MSCKLVLFVCVAFLFGTSFFLVFIHAHEEGNYFSLAEKKKEDAKIRNILYGETPINRSCVNISLHRKTDINLNDNFLWTVVILKEEILTKNLTISIQQCTGSLIHPKVVLTATHCILKKKITDLKVRAGICDEKHEEPSKCHQDRQIKRKVYQNRKNYNASVPIKDIALLFLKKKFDQSPYIGTVCLLPMPVQANVKCFVTGWHSSSLKNYGAIFKKIKFKTISSDKCQEVLRMTGLGKEFELPKSFMCAGGKFHQHTIDLNGGAPLVCPICKANGQMAQVGVMSWGFKRPPIPEVLTSVSSAYDWIQGVFVKKNMTLPDCGFKPDHDDS